MMENKELPSEYISIRNIWLQSINDCRKAISQVANIEASSEMKSEFVVGARTTVHTIDALYLSLVDYGEALIKTDVDKWKKEYYWPKSNKIWSKETNKELSADEKWWKNYNLSKKLYEKILDVLNKYGMLFEKQPEGYSNVIMEEIY